MAAARKFYYLQFLSTTCHHCDSYKNGNPSLKDVIERELLGVNIISGTITIVNNDNSWTKGANIPGEMGKVPMFLIRELIRIKQVPFLIIVPAPQWRSAQMDDQLAIPYYQLPNNIKEKPQDIKGFINSLPQPVEVNPNQALVAAPPRGQTVSPVAQPPPPSRVNIQTNKQAWSSFRPNQGAILK